MSRDPLVTWREMLTEELKANGEGFSDIVSLCAAPNRYSWDPPAIPYEGESWLDEKFDSGYGGTRGAFFTVWTHKRVYFPVCYDGAEWVGSVARNPDGIATPHQGGG